MERLLSKSKGLLIVLIMVFSLFVPIIVSASQHTIKFDPNGGKWNNGSTSIFVLPADQPMGVYYTMSSENVKKVTGSNQPTKNGYDFIGWKDVVDDTIYDYGALLMRTYARGRTYIAKWQEKVMPIIMHKVTVNYTCDGKEIDSTQLFDVQENQSFLSNINLMIALGKDIAGYSRIGIFDEGSNIVNDLDSILVTRDMTLTVKYDAKHIVKYCENANAGQEPGICTYGKLQFSSLTVAADIIKQRYDYEETVIISPLKHVIRTIPYVLPSVYKIIDGNHNIGIQKGTDLVVRSDGEVSTSFKTVAADRASVSEISPGGGPSGGGPKTGDSGIAMWGALLSLSLVGAAASVKYLKKVK